ncbi:MAG: aldehyde ferredoxin oxidoreductase family protein [Desulfobacteraceae bacterium]|nr:aldehyde ferredoxin oxidoreductase family protein [Desulfobacteraceae bacterium]
MGPLNKLVFALGPLSGVPLSGCGRNSVGAKSPLTNAYGEAEVGGFWGAELKRAGYDAIILEGKSSTPCYLWIKDNNVGIRDAAAIWGMEIADTHAALRRELGDGRIRTSIIGPAGENLVRYACIMNDVKHAAGRTGLGAVMGSKNLKAIAVRGTRMPEVADKETIRGLQKWIANNFKSRTHLWKYGTGADIEGYNLTGNLPVKNYKKGYFNHAREISARRLSDIFTDKMGTCHSCVVRCKKEVYGTTATIPIDPAYGGPEYETIAQFGSNCMVDDPEVICKAHELCNRYGMDTISAGGTIAFAMECFENGLLTTSDTNGIELSFGNAQALLDTLSLIAHKKGIGALLAEGSRRAARKIGNGAEAFAMDVKGLELAMHEPRLMKGMGLHYSVHATGADHVTGVFDTHLSKDTVKVENWQMVDSSAAPVPPDELSPRKVNMLYRVELWSQLLNSLVLCAFVPYRYDQIRDAVRAVTGWSLSYEALMKCTERSIALMRIFNLREGFNRSDDRLPDRFAEPPEEGALADESINPPELAEMQEIYYQLMGWDYQGKPTNAKLDELDIRWAEEYLN